MKSKDNILREKQKAEAIRRLKEMKVAAEVVNILEQEDGLIFSERIDGLFQSVMYQVTEDMPVSAKIKEFEEENEAFVYHAQLTHMKDSHSDAWTFLYVSPDEEEWQDERFEIQNPDAEGVISICAYSSWIADEIGYVGIKPFQGGVVRVW